MSAFKRMTEICAAFVAGFGFGLFVSIGVGAYFGWCFHHHGKVIEKRPEIYDGGHAL